jgi:exopolysaccharide biosynthesis polyprenyl glycosylphosphotransferase
VISAAQEPTENFKSQGLPRIEAKAVPYAFAKRLFDIVCASVLLLIFFPVILILAILVRLSSKGPAFYRSTRVGLGGEPFLFLKLRSMRTDADTQLAELSEHNEKDGPIFKMKNDPRVTPIGRFIRRYSLDELPQFVHVLMGQMSMVGPRPPLPREVERYDEHTMGRLSVKPGISCYWQVMGRSNLSFEEWVELDLRYIEEMSFWVDLCILWKTPAAVFRARGAY